MSVDCRVLSWNCRGAKTGQFLRNARELLASFCPLIFVILEPRISAFEADDICRRLGKRDWVRSDADGFSGGIWVLWNRDEVSLRVVYVEKYFIHLIIDEGRRAAWELTAVYASPKHHLRPPIWERIGLIQHKYPWALIGDFNCTLADHERNTVGRMSRSFATWVQSLGLIDAGFIGPIFTWNHGREVDTRRSARLDRLLTDEEWRRLFPEATLTHLPHSHSDHCPILLQTKRNASVGMGRRPFRFLAAWMEHRDFTRVIEENWRTDINVPASLDVLKEALTDWNKNVFGNIFARKKKLLRRLAGAQRALSTSPTAGLIKLEEKLKRELNVVLQQEELLWMQKSRVQWLRAGDKNTRFFHTSTLIRRRRSRIEALRDSQGAWITDQQRLKDMALSYYSSLFTSDAIGSVNFINGKFPPLSQVQLLQLAAPCTDEEVHQALKQMSPFKAPGPDGFQAGFFQSTWTLTGPSITALVRRVLSGGELPPGLAEILLVLVPKIEHPSSLTEF